MITVKDLTKRYARTTAVDHISFAVKKGQIVGFLGPNGAGKTTTMRMLTCFLPPTSGTATVAGFDVFEQPIEVKKRIGYLPETPPLYLEMETIEYLRFVGRLKGLSGADLEKRVAYVCDRCAIADVKTKLLGKLSKGYRQRVGLAQAIIHNPDVLILDEPTSGLDPKQINETRDLIKASPATTPSSSAPTSCPKSSRPASASSSSIKASSSPPTPSHNLQARARGAESVLVEIAARTGDLAAPTVQQRLEQIAGVSRVALKEQRGAGSVFEVESRQGTLVRGDLARAIVEAGWDLNELRPAAMSLEEIFLQLTGGDRRGRRSRPNPPKPPLPRPQA